MNNGDDVLLTRELVMCDKQADDTDRAIHTVDTALKEPCRSLIFPSAVRPLFRCIPLAAGQCVVSRLTSRFKFASSLQQESLADAKVNVRQLCVYEGPQ